MKRQPNCSTPCLSSLISCQPAAPASTRDYTNPHRKSAAGFLDTIYFHPVKRHPCLSPHCGGDIVFMDLEHKCLLCGKVY